MRTRQSEKLFFNQEIWNAQVIKNGSDFLQFYQWGEFQETIGQRVLRLNIDGLPVQAVKYHLPLGQSYLYLPHISIKYQVSSIKHEDFLQRIKRCARDEGAVFIRIDPLTIRNSGEAEKWQGALQRTGFRPAPEGYYFSAVSQSPYVAVLDISQSEEQILKVMRYNTRRSIRLAQERGVSVSQSDNIRGFYELLQQTTQRKGIQPHPKEHYFKLKEIFGDDLILFLAYKKSCHCFVAPRNDNLLAGAMFLFFNKQATYLHAGSLPSRENCEAPYLVLWHAICEAKKYGCHTLDLGAIAPENSQNHPWQSITTFKMGFRPERLNYLGAYDWVNKKMWYWLYCWKKNLTV